MTHEQHLQDKMKSKRKQQSKTDAWGQKLEKKYSTLDMNQKKKKSINVRGTLSPVTNTDSLPLE